MRFTILSHAGMYVEHKGTSLVTDPWLIGSCYWRSWWNFPEPKRALVENLRPDYIYISHLHWDHYHGISLKKLFDRKTRVLVPKVCTTRMVDDLKTMGFRNVEEIPHDSEVRLGDDFTLASYQFGIGVDSAAIIKGGGIRLYDLNDCKLFGWPLHHLAKRHGRPDFVLRSHSSASAVPYCVEGYRKDFAELRTRQDYIEEFSRAAISLEAKYAIPFASNHCFLHKDTIHFNDTAVSPSEVAAYCNQLAEQVGSSTRCVVMAPGSSWSEEKGFQLADFDFSRREEYIQDLLREHQDTLQRYYEEEDRETADFESFRDYFKGFLKAVPLLVRLRWSAPFVFRVADRQGTHHWLIRPRTKEIAEVEAPPPEAILIDVSPRVLNDCTQMRMFSVWTASKRLRIHLPKPAALKKLRLLFSVLDAYELENVGLLKNFHKRHLGVFLRRWREGAEMFRLVVKHVIFRRPFRIRDLYPIVERVPSSASASVYEPAETASSGTGS